MQNYFRRFMVFIVLLIIGFTFVLPETVVFAEGGDIFFPIFIKSADVYHAFGLDGGTVEGIVIDPTDSDTLYANSWGAGVYKSTNGGQTWENKSEGLESGFIYELAIDPSDHLHILASDYEHGLKQSVDGGNNWNPVTGITPGSVIYAIEFNPQNPSIVYLGLREPTIYVGGEAVAWPGGVFKSTNGGSNWVRKDYGLPSDPYKDYVYGLAIDPNNPNIIYTAMHRTGVYKTVDGGEHWVSKNNTMIDGDVRSVHVTPDSSRVYIGFWDGYGMSYSEDGGETWVSVEWTNANNLNVWEVQVDPNRPNYVYLSTSIGIYLCKNPSQYSTCSVFAYGGKFAFDLTFDENGPKMDTGNTAVVYTGLQTHAIFKSTNGGGSFEPMYKGIRANIVNKILIDPIDPNVQYLSAQGRGLFKTVDNGANWIDLREALPIEYINDLVFRQQTNNVLYAATKFNGIFISDDSGSSWTALNNGLTRSAESVDQQLFKEPTSAEIYSWMDPVDLEDMITAGAYVSGDRAGSSYDVTTIGFHSDPTQSQNMFIGTNGAGVKLSNNGGLDWTASEISNGIVTDSLVAGGRYFISFDGWGVYYSNDRTSWEEFNRGMPGKVNVITAIPGTTIYLAGTDDGVYRAETFGGQWYQRGINGIPVSDILVDPNFSSRLWATTKYGLYCSMNSGASWSYYDLPEIPNTELLTIVAVPGTTSFLIGTNGGDYYEFTP